jgi:hypothetical protein
MALQFEYTTNMGITATEAYVKINSFSGNKDDIEVHLSIYYNNAARLTNKSPIGGLFMSLDLPNGGTMTQMYSALKALPQFAGAVDA